MLTTPSLPTHRPHPLHGCDCRGAADSCKWLGGRRRPARLWGRAGCRLRTGLWNEVALGRSQRWTSRMGNDWRGVVLVAHARSGSNSLVEILSLARPHRHLPATPQPPRDGRVEPDSAADQPLEDTGRCRPDRRALRPPRALANRGGSRLHRLDQGPPRRAHLDIARPTTPRLDYYLNPAEVQMAAKATYGKLPNIAAVNAACGSAETGWLTYL